MGLLEKIYTTVNNKILFYSKNHKNPSVKEQMDFLRLFPEPSSVFERAHFKYECLIFYSYSKKQKILINLLSFFGLIVLVPYYRLRGLSHDKDKIENAHSGRLLRKSTKRIPITDIYPYILDDQYDEIVDYEGVSYKKIFITHDAFNYFKRAFHSYPGNFHFLVVLLVRLSQASYILHRYSPQCVTTYVCEREFSDPVLTEYYKENGVEYHGFMHGDYLFSLQQAFMSYTKYWVWNEHYRDLFLSLKCKFDTEIYLPKKYSGIVKPRENIKDYDYYATYYFSGESEKSVLAVRDVLMELQSKGYKCKVRPHPRFSHMDFIHESFDKYITVEDPYNVSIEDSLENSYLTISTASTVLSQAYYSGKKIVIDDVSNPQIIENLRERRYILVDKADMLLSELLKENT